MSYGLFALKFMLDMVWLMKSIKWIIDSQTKFSILLRKFSIFELIIGLASLPYSWISLRPSQNTDDI